MPLAKTNIYYKRTVERKFSAAVAVRIIHFHFFIVPDVYRNLTYFTSWSTKRYFSSVKEEKKFIKLNVVLNF
jgi:hypothetical protein